MSEQKKTATANAEQSAAPTAAVPPVVKRPTFRRKSAVVRPVLKLVENEPIYFRVDEPMFIGERIDPKKDPATLMHVTDLATGEESVVVVTRLLKDAFTKNYPENGYVGRCFEASVLKLKASGGGNNYRPVQLYEIEDPA